MQLWAVVELGFILFHWTFNLSEIFSVVTRLPLIFPSCKEAAIRFLRLCDWNIKMHNFAQNVVDFNVSMCSQPNMQYSKKNVKF